jgi:selenocysteine insertion sequence-binding protein 2
VNETSEAAGSGYPIEGILEAARAHGVPVVFALTRRKMGKLLGQKKTVSVFALLNVQGAEQEFDEVFRSCMT